MKPEKKLLSDQFILTPFFTGEPVPAFNELVEEGWKIVDPALPKEDQQARMDIIHEGIAKETEAALNGNKRPVHIMGDCCCTIGVVAGLQRAEQDFTFLWFDSHGDFNNWETSPSGFLGGMPLAMMVGIGEQRLTKAVKLKTLPEDQVWLSDGRDLDPGELQLLEKSNVHWIKDPLTLLDGNWPAGPLYVHFDSDVLPTDQVPAMRYPVAGGRRADEWQSLFQQLAASGQVVATSMTAWYPSLDKDGKTAEICLETYRTLIG